MCTAWAPSGHVFAACGQDGVVCVWDVRSSKVGGSGHLRSIFDDCLGFSEYCSSIPFQFKKVIE